MPDNRLFGNPVAPLDGTLGDLDAIDGVRRCSEVMVVLFEL